MERLTIDIPESKSAEIKQFLNNMGVYILTAKPLNISEYQEKLMTVGNWSEEELIVFEDSRKAVGSFKPQQW